MFSEAHSEVLGTINLNETHPMNELGLYIY